MTNIDNYDPAGALLSYYPNRLTNRTARHWAREVTLHNWADLGAVEFFEGGGTNPSTLTSYAKDKLWLRVDAGVTSAPAEIRYYAGGDETLLASWPLIDKQGFAGQLRARSDAETDFAWSTATSGDPGSGKVRGNAAIGSITQLAVSKTGRLGQSYALRIATIDDGDVLRIYGVGGDDNFLDLNVTGAPADQTTYYTIACTVAASSSLSDGQVVGLAHYPVGAALDRAPAAVQVTTRAELAAETQTRPVFLTEAGRAGWFIASTPTGAAATRAAADTAQGVHVSAGGGVYWIRQYADGKLRPEWFGAKGDNTTDDSAAIQAMFDASNDLTTARRAVEFTAGRSYVIDSTITIGDPNELTVFAHGATFRIRSDIVMFDCNGRADPTYVDNESRQNFWWLGGDFINSSASPTVATGLLMRGFRNAGVDMAHFEGFAKAIHYSSKDTLYFDRLKFFNNTKCLANDAWSPIGGLLNIFVRGCHFSHANSSSPAVECNDPVSEFFLRGCSFNLGTGADHAGGVIAVRRRVQLYVTSSVGTWQVGETVEGLTSGATMVLSEVVDHGDGSLRLMGGTLTGTFSAAETVEGQTSTATATTGAANQLSQNPTNRVISIADNHWESGSGAAGSLICVSLRDEIGTGNKPTSVEIASNNFGTNGGGMLAVDLQRWSRVRFSANVFAQTTGNGTPIRLDANCSDIVIDASNSFSTSGVSLNGCPRNEVKLPGWDYTISTTGTITGYDGNTKTGTGSETIDMSVAAPSSFALAVGLAPRGYEINWTVRDSGSAGATNSRLRVTSSNTINTNRRFLIDLEGKPNDTNVGRSGFIAADDNGDLFVDWLAAGTMTISAKVEKVCF